jgi:hypothetical protein
MNTLLSFLRSALAASVLLVTIPAHAWDLSLVGGIDFGNQNVSSAPLVLSADTGFSGGVLVGQALSDHFALETGLLYLPRPLSAFSILGGPTTRTEFRALWVPLTARWSPWPFLAIVAGGYVAHGVGNLITKDSSGATLLSESYETGQINRTDYGFLLGSGFLIPVGKKIDLRIDLEYAGGLPNVDTSKATSDKFVDFLILAGARVEL